MLLASAGQDSYSNPIAKLGFGTRNLVEAGDYPLTRISNDYMLMLALYRSHWIIRKVIDVMAEDMLKEFPHVTAEMDPKRIKDFDRVVSDTATEQKLLEALKWSRLFGGSVAIIAIEGASDLKKPLVIDDILPGTYRGLIVKDRWSGVFPESELETDMNDPASYGLPKFYRCDTEEGGESVMVHHSRLLRFTGRELPAWEKQVQMYWGLSEVELVFDELRKRDYASWSIVSLLSRANILAMKETQLAQAQSGALVSNDAFNRYTQRMQAISDTLSNQGILVLPNEGGLDNHQYSFGGVADVYSMGMLDVAGACEIPVSRLYGRTITGLGATGEGDLQIYYDTVEQKRRRELRPQMNTLVKVLAMSTWGQVPDDLDYEFPPVRTLTDKDRAELIERSSKPILEGFNAQLFGRKTALRMWRSLDNEVGTPTQITDEMIEDADDDVQPAGELGFENPLLQGNDDEEEPGGEEDGAKRRLQVVK